MGFSTWHWLKKDLKMKFVAAACLIVVAFAEPEAKADPALLYGAYGYGGYVGYAAPYSLGYSAYNYGAYPYTYGARYIGKRSADAEPEADAALLYGNYGYTGYTGYAGYAAPYSLGYSAYNYGAYPYTYGARYLGKRSADAEPEADAALLYGNYGYTGYTGVAGYAAPYSLGYSAYNYG